MADLSGLAGKGNNDWAKAEQILKDAGVSNYSSGLRDYVLTGNQNYSYGDAQQYGLPLSQSQIQGEQSRLRSEAIAPVVSSLEASKAEVGAKYDTRDAQIQAEKDPLIARYDKVLSDVTGKITQQNVQEFSRRGIDPSSGIVGKTINQQALPYTVDLTAQKEDALRGLNNSQQDLFSGRIEEMRNITNTIANLKANGANQAITDALTQAQAAPAHKWDVELADIKAKAPTTPSYTDVTTKNGVTYLYDKNTGVSQILSSAGAKSKGNGTWEIVSG